MENNLTFTAKVVREDDFDYSLIKTFLFLSFNFLSGFLSFYYFKIFLVNLNLKSLLISFILWGLFFIFLLINVFLIKSVKKLFWFSFLVAFLSFFIFFEYYQNLLMVGAFIFFIFLFFGFKIGNETLKNSLKIKFFDVADLVIKKFVFGFLIFLILIFSVFYFDFKKGEFNKNINEVLIKSAVYLIKPILNIYFDIDPNLTLREIFKNLALREIKTTVEDFKDYLPQIKDKIINEAIEKNKISLEERFKIKLDLEKDLDTNFKANISNYLDNLKNKDKVNFIIGFLLFLFFLLNFLFKVFSLIYVFLAFILYKLLIVINFVQLSLETRSREFLVMK